MSYLIVQDTFVNSFSHQQGEDPGLLVNRKLEQYWRLKAVLLSG